MIKLILILAISLGLMDLIKDMIKLLPSMKKTVGSFDAVQNGTSF